MAEMFVKKYDDESGSGKFTEMYVCEWCEEEASYDENGKPTCCKDAGSAINNGGMCFYCDKLVNLPHKICEDCVNLLSGDCG